MARETVPEAGVLLVLNPVTHYEKIKRIGEGTYGVVRLLPDKLLSRWFSPVSYAGC